MVINEYRYTHISKSDGLPLSVLRIEPDGSRKIKGIVQLVHGMCEHKERYVDFMKMLAEKGYISVIHDNRGHGESVKSKDDYGYFYEGGYKALIEDIHEITLETKKYVEDELGIEGLPYILMGHSMGSFIVRIAAAEYGMFDKLIVMGTGGPNPAAGIGLAVIKAIKALKGEKHISKTVYSLAFGSYNKKFASENDVFSWLSKDRSVRERYAADKFCNYKFTSSAMGDLVTLNKLSNTKEINSKLACKKPILLVSGGDDPVGENGAGVKKVCAELKSLGADVEMKIYDNCRHEILNDTCRGEVIKDIIDFVKQK